ncbi:hypothetical protein THMIRHAS_08170 [Thiosulfatimonas sediminis]|uniref:histidine kinase n=1 Tax=Thiosulfatimonas sediminis TaxID=2675054 RepID=A0A6F8PTV2_9GAMM|nr:response regulator [Thiosulfatimonas sediminis]BBP45444.1 hypothetical protein THMIRHAS_08170 [Thiosulfatimonas sediminis]
MINQHLRLLLPFILIIIGLAAIVVNMDFTLRNEQQAKNNQQILDQVTGIIRSNLTKTNEDVQFIAALPLAEAFLHNPQDERSYQQLSDTLLKFTNSRQDYHQLRLLDKNGMEKLRIELNKRTLNLVPEEELQDKSDRYYYQAAKTLSPGEIYQSPLDLNIEFDKIERPFRPTLRFVQGIFSGGEILGYVVLNYNVNSIFRNLDRVMANYRNEQTKLYIANQQGYLLYSPNDTQNWGFMFNRPDLTLEKIQPLLWQKIQQQTHAEQALKIEQNLYFYQHICAFNSCLDLDPHAVLPNQAEDLPWYLISETPSLNVSNLFWLNSYWPYMMLLLMLSTILLVLKISQKLGRTYHTLVEKQQDIRNSEQRFAKVIESIPDGLIILNEKAKIETVNPAAEAIFGVDKMQLLGNPIEVLMSGHFKEMHYSKTDDFYHNPRRIEITRERPYCYKHPNGSTHFVQATINPLKTADGVIAIVLVKDVTKSLKQEDKLRQSQKLDALGQLTGGVAHDFNNLLAIMLGNLELLEMQAQGQDKLLTRITKITNAVNSAADLTQKLLTVSRRKNLSAQTVDLKTFMESTMDMLLRTIKQQKVQISYSIEDNIPAVFIDPNELTNALINLLLNARDAMPNGGKIFIRIENAYLDQDYIKSISDTIKQGKYVLISVEDNGCGIPKGLLDKVLEPFFTTKEKDKGTGLGLAMIYGFIKQSNGHMRIYSEEGSGTNIHLYLPTIENADTKVPIKHDVPVLPPENWSNLRALVVDDEVELAEVAASYLELTGITVDVCHSADSAWQKVQQQSYDIVFSDIVMPGEMDGIDLLKKLKEQKPNTAVILTSGFSEEMLTQQYQLQEKAVFVHKPYKRDQVTDAIIKALKK